VTPAEGASLAADVNGIRELVADLAAEAAGIATTLTACESVTRIIDATYRHGYSEGRGAWDDHQAEANAQARRAQFRLVQGGRAPKARKAGGAS
jgi:hypothetical protein